MTAKRFTLIIDSEWWIVEDNSIKSNKYRNDLDGDDAYRGLKEGELTEKEVVDLLNELHEENEQLRHDATILIQSNQDYRKENEQLKQLIRKLEKQIHLVHMSSMFSTVKSFKGDVSKRYKYSEETDTIYDTANTYGQYNKILDKKEVVMLLNEYETLLEGD